MYQRHRSTALYNHLLLVPAQRDRITVVLVSPRNPLNIGAVARAMANFGFSRLAVVAPYEEHWREAKSAVGAEDLLQQAQVFSSLREAIAGCHLVLGTGTLTYRKAEQPVVALPDLAPEIATALSPSAPAPQNIALVFGQEKHGLTRDDLSWCHRLIEIPTDPAQPSMNLAQAVAVCLYELTRTPSRDYQSGDTPNLTTASPVASSTLDLLAGIIGETMIAANYSPEEMGAANQHDLRLLVRRLNLDSRDTQRALGFFRRVLWQIKHLTRGSSRS